MGNLNSSGHSEEFEERPKVKATINGREVFLLYDTGSQFCLMDTGLFNSLKVAKRNCVDSVEKITGVVGKSKKCKSFTCDLDLTIQNKTVTQRFTVFENNEPAIIGIDFIHKFGLQYNVVKRDFKWRSNKYPSHLNPFSKH